MIKISFERVEELASGDKKTTKTILDMYVEMLDKCHAKCKQAIVENSAELWYSSLHELKGSSNNIGFSEFGNICKEVEQLQSKQKMLECIPILKTHANYIKTVIANYITKNEL